MKRRHVETSASKRSNRRILRGVKACGNRGYLKKVEESKGAFYSFKAVSHGGIKCASVSSWSDALIVFDL